MTDTQAPGLRALLDELAELRATIVEYERQFGRIRALVGDVTDGATTLPTTEQHRFAARRRKPLPASSAGPSLAPVIPLRARGA